VGVAVGETVGVGVGPPGPPHFVPTGIGPVTSSSHNPLSSTT
jgi:hypothetical protein